MESIPLQYRMILKLTPKMRQGSSKRALLFNLQSSENSISQQNTKLLDGKIHISIQLQFIFT